MFETTRYQLVKPGSGFAEPLHIALVTDLHDRPCADVLAAIEAYSPDIIAVAGDLMDGFKFPCRKQPDNRNAYEFLSRACRIAPVFYSPGNHERCIGQEDKAAILRTGAVLLDNCSVNITVCGKRLCIGGLATQPDTEWLRRFSGAKGFKLLLSHHPEYYPRYILDTDIDVILSGHAHGGQWRIASRGLYAPGQGLLPDYCGGMYDSRLVVSRGLANTVPIPRLNNPTELVTVEIRE